MALGLRNPLKLRDYPGAGGFPFSQVVLLLGYEGADASTTFTDESSYARTMTAVGNAQIDTAQSKFGSASGLFDGTGDCVTTPDAAVFTLGSGDWTMETWVRFNSVSGFQSFFSQWGAVANNTSKSWTFVYFAGTGLQFYWNSANSRTFAWSPSTNTWYHVAMCRSGSNLRAFVDGTQVGSTASVSGQTIENSTEVLAVGSDSAPTSFLNAWLDESRIIVGTALYTSNFTAPIAAFPRS
jgi:hypothetical protein